MVIQNQIIWDLTMVTNGASKQQDKFNDDPLRNQEIHIVNSVEECRVVIEQLRLHCNEYNVLGFDCEWIPYGVHPVALMQLATHRGLCVLIRLCKLETLPSELQRILEDKNILKVGIEPHGDARRLVNDYKRCGLRVVSTLDLRFLAVKCKHQPFGLAKLSAEHLNVALNKNYKIHKKWENDTLDFVNIKYAADDAHVGIEIFKKFKEELTSKNTSKNCSNDLQRFIDEYCLCYLNKQFKIKRTNHKRYPVRHHTPRGNDKN